MKNYVFLVIAGTIMLFAQNEKTIQNKLDDFISNDPEWRFSIISNFASKMDISERQYIYNKYHKDALGPFFLNLLLPIGSLVQGDFTTVGVTLCLDLIGVGLLSTSMLSIGLYAARQGTAGQMPRSTLDGIYVQMFASLAILGISELYKLIAPWAHAGSVNDYLERALNLKNSNKLSFNISPSISYLPGSDVSFGLLFSYKL